MKYIVLAIPGAADYPCDELTEKTPFEVAKLPHLHALAKIGRVGLVKLASDRLDPSSDVTLLNLLGYEADKVYTGRGPLEAANLELKLEDNEIAFRMNFITEADGKLADPTGGGLTTKEARALINFLNKKVASDFVRFFAGSEYRHVAVLKDSHGFAALSAKTNSPEGIMGEPIDQHFPKGPGEELLKKLMFDAKLLLQDHEINQVRVDLQENPANMIWLWGQGPQPKIEKFADIYEVSSAMISATEYSKGVGRITGMSVFEIGKTPDQAEDLAAAAKVLQEAVEEKDVVVLYLSDCDEASRVGDLRAKITAMEAIDAQIISKIREILDKKKDVRVLVTSNHAAPWKLGKHTKDPVPFVIAGKNVMPDDVEKFSEVTAKASGWKLPNGRELMKSFLAK
ncbi:MAG: 2,3-bisphosphoglycerate-independent phosphoglycerate mutase [Candidatus Omnitrophica bacterium]|nr:2,3-bisphosphoglycerate-independent phosphoglycerate mutase [Candidatus Omnitrophota bacterium]